MNFYINLKPFIHPFTFRYVMILSSNETRNTPIDGLKELVLLLDFFSCWSLSLDMLDSVRSVYRKSIILIIIIIIIYKEICSYILLIMMVEF